jgi:glycosyltransferase involved in cell wall biosynthesis
VKILFVTQYGVLAASSRTRVFHYLPHLEAAGYQCDVLTVLPDRRISGSQILVTRQLVRKFLYYVWAFWRTFICGVRALLTAHSYDLLFVQKVIFPPFVRWLFRLNETPIIYDFDDAIFTTEVRERNWLAQRKHNRNSAGVPAMLRLAQLALVENEYTASFAHNYCPHVAIITGPIDTCRYSSGTERVKRGEVVLGWIGSSSTLPYLEMIRPALEEIGRRLGHVRLHVVGAVDMELQHMPVVSKAWSLEEEVEDLRNFDIGLMPMPDDPWTRGKGGYKLLQYMAVALPVITSPVGINRQIVDHGENGFWAETAEQWQEKIEHLVADAELRRHMGRAGRKKMERVYSLNKARETLEKLLLETKNGHL